AVLTDLNQRAVRFAKLNARLNGIENAEILSGDLLDPVEGRKFDLVLANPPFVVSPGSDHIYADGGNAGDEIGRRIVREIPKVLAPGGFCQLLLNWAHGAAGDWREPLRRWFAESPCDVWVLRHETMSAADYAAEWIAATETVEPRPFTEHHRRWMRFYASRSIASVSLGLVNMRLDGDGGGGFRAEDVPDLFGNWGADIERGFRLRAFLDAGAGEQALLSASFTVAEDVRLRQSLRPFDQGWAPETMRVVRTRGLGYRGDVDAFAAGLISRCDGTRSLASLIEELARHGGGAPSEWRGRILPVIRTMVEEGFLIPTTLPPSGG
ncbi:MAG: methyltransferase, partial [Candidatus Latescibacteria bacterium]|nr:methyltransferase [Candidatus Latescibacterota bacterium]